MVNARLQELCDRADIFDCIYRYARGIDRMDRELLRSAYHDDAVDDHVGFVGPVDDFIDWPFAYHATQTRTPVLSDEPHGRDQAIKAHSETYYIFVGTDRDPGKPLIVSGGRYVDRLARRDGRWAIVARFCLVEWQSESASLLPPDAIAFLDSVQTVSRDSGDDSYDRPLNITRVPLSK